MEERPEFPQDSSGRAGQFFLVLELPSFGLCVSTHFASCFRFHRLSCTLSLSLSSAGVPVPLICAGLVPAGLEVSVFVLCSVMISYDRPSIYAGLNYVKAACLKGEDGPVITLKHVSHLHLVYSA